MDAHAGGLQRPAPRVAHLGVVAEYRKDGHVAARFQPFRHRVDEAEGPFPGDPVHVGDLCVFQRGLPAQALDGPVRHAVAQKHCVFHFSLSSSMRMRTVFPFRIARRSISFRADRTSFSRDSWVVMTTGTAPALSCALPFWMTAAIEMLYFPSIPEIFESTPGRSRAEKRK